MHIYAVMPNPKIIHVFYYLSSIEIGIVRMVVHTRWILYVHVRYDLEVVNYQNKYYYSMTTQATSANLSAKDPIDYIVIQFIFNYYISYINRFISH